jgi:predicted NUDIX family NTP pyrophosphohydrolase
MPHLSAGLLLFRRNAGGELEVLLVHPGGPLWRNKDEHAWSIPKGECDDGEDQLTTADREFGEELGIAAPAGRRIDLGTIRQASGKQVRAWAVEAPDLLITEVVSNEFEMEWPPRSGRRQSFPEVDRAEWMTLSVARPRVVKAQAEFFDRLGDALGGKGD